MGQGRNDDRSADDLHHALAWVKPISHLEKISATNPAGMRLMIDPSGIVSLTGAPFRRRLAPR
jgi:hypothetical protein